MIEFLVEIRTRLPASVPEEQRVAAHTDEARAVAQLAAEGHLLRLWRLARPDGEITIGLWRATDVHHLHTLLAHLPLRRWMDLRVDQLHRHPNDPHPGLSRRPISMPGHG